MDKVSLRNLIKVELRKMSSSELEIISMKFNQRLILAYQYLLNTYKLKEPIVGAYVPQLIEPQLNWGSLKQNLGISRMALPQIENGELKYCLWDDNILPKDWKQPWVGAMIEPELIFVPSLSMSPQGFRLGQGGGYFDQYLATGADKIKVGICVKKYFNDQWKPEKHDIAFDYVLTEDFLWSVKTMGFVEVHKEK